MGRLLVGFGLLIRFVWNGLIDKSLYQPLIPIETTLLMLNAVGWADAGSPTVLKARRWARTSAPTYFRHN
jgi:hypothetical protein